MSTYQDARLLPLGNASQTTRAAIAKAIVRRVVERVDVRVRLADGQTIGAGGPDSPVLELRSPEAFYRRLAQHPKIGIGDGYVTGEWQPAPGTDLADALVPFAARLDALIPRPLLALRGLADSALPTHHRGTIENARTNISAHYDLSNALFAAFLDPSMTYSSALFAGAGQWRQQPLQEAQWRKIDRALDEAGVAPGSRVLEIGTGWGELAIRAAARGAEVVSITLSAEQQQLARERASAAGLSDRVDIRLQDYRDVAGEFDAIVSIEMIEAVGEEFWPDYFRAIDRLLAPGGRAVIQAILMDHQRLLATRHSHGWIQEYIFPGGLIPSLRAIDLVTGTHTHLRRRATFSFGPHYAETLRRWRERFLATYDAIAGPGFDDQFKRRWEFYLAYCEAGFAAGYLDVAQLTFGKDQS